MVKNSKQLVWWFAGLFVALMVILIALLQCESNNKDPQRELSKKDKYVMYLEDLAEKPQEELLPHEERFIDALQPLYDNYTRVLNPDSILTQDECLSLDSCLLKLDSLEIQTVVLICDHIYGDDPKSFSEALGAYLGVGGEKNLGIVVILALEDGSYWVSTGVGIEKILPNEIIHDMENYQMLPSLAKGEWCDAMHSFLNALCQYFEKFTPN